MRNVFPLGGIVFGVGAGGFVDGIVLHQLLGWHHMLSGWYPLTEPGNMTRNMVADGFFHLLCLVFVLAGAALLVRAAPVMPPSRGRRAFGWMLAGWGVFNVVEGVVDHLVLGVHHVRPGSAQLAWDLGFLVFGAALLAAGTLIGSRGARRGGAGRGTGGRQARGPGRAVRH